MRVCAPERVPPDVERLREAVDVFGDAQLGDAPLAGHLAVALDVGRREVLGRGGVEVVGAQVEVVVGEHWGERFKQIQAPGAGQGSEARRASSSSASSQVERRW